MANSAGEIQTPRAAYRPQVRRRRVAGGKQNVVDQERGPAREPGPPYAHACERLSLACGCGS